MGCLMILRRTTGENKPEQAASSKVLSILFLSLGKVGKKNRLDKFLTVQISIAPLNDSRKRYEETIIPKRVKR